LLSTDQLNALSTGAFAALSATQVGSLRLLGSVRLCSARWRQRTSQPSPLRRSVRLTQPSSPALARMTSPPSTPRSLPRSQPLSCWVLAQTTFERSTRPRSQG
jgi:hypothetical protein